MEDKVIMLFSGGSDSTYAATFAAERFKEVHLVTYTRGGLIGTERSKLNARRLCNKYRNTVFKHIFINVDKLQREVAYGNYFQDLLKHRFFVLASCPLCKLAFVIRTIVYSLETKIYTVYDGYVPHRGRQYVSQIEPIVNKYKAFYKSFGIKYETPIWNEPARPDRILYKMGIFEVPEVKYNNPEDDLIQATCYPRSLYHVIARGYYFPLWGHDRFEKRTDQYLSDKFALFKRYIQEYLNDKVNNKLSRLLEPPRPVIEYQSEISN